MRAVPIPSRIPLGVGILSLARRYERDRLEAACARALTINAITYSSVNAILKIRPRPRAARGRAGQAHAIAYQVPAAAPIINEGKETNDADVIGEPTIADAILDRIVHNAHRVTFEGDSMRKQRTPPLLTGTKTAKSIANEFNQATGGRPHPAVRDLVKLLSAIQRNDCPVGEHYSRSPVPMLPDGSCEMRRLASAC